MKNFLEKAIENHMGFWKGTARLLHNNDFNSVHSLSGVWYNILNIRRNSKEAKKTLEKYLKDSSDNITVMFVKKPAFGIVVSDTSFDNHYGSIYSFSVWKSQNSHVSYKKDYDNGYLLTISALEIKILLRFKFPKETGIKGVHDIQIKLIRDESKEYDYGVQIFDFEVIIQKSIIHAYVKNSEVVLEFLKKRFPITM